MTDLRSHDSNERPGRRGSSIRLNDYATTRAVTRSIGFVPLDLSGYFRSLQAEAGLDLGRLIRLTENSPMFLTGSRHLKRRARYAKLLDRARARAWQPYVEQVVSRCIDRLATIPMPDLVRDYTDPVYQAATGAMLGLRGTDSPVFSARTQDIRCLFLEPMLPVRKFVGLEASVKAMLEEVDDRPDPLAPAGPCPVLQQLMEHLSDDFERQDAIALTVILYVAGQTTPHTLGNILGEILLAPREQRAVAAEPTWVAANLENLIRLHASPHCVDRISARDQEVGGCPFRRGDHVHLHLHSANRDPAQFIDQDSFSGSHGARLLRHLGFGIGPHKCPGAAWARMVISVALPPLLARYPTLSLDVARVQWHHTMFNRAPVSLPCQLETEG